MRRLPAVWIRQTTAKGQCRQRAKGNSDLNGEKVSALTDDCSF